MMWRHSRDLAGITVMTLLLAGIACHTLVNGPVGSGIVGLFLPAKSEGMVFSVPYWFRWFPPGAWIGGGGPWAPKDYPFGPVVYYAIPLWASTKRAESPAATRPTHRWRGFLAWLLRALRIAHIAVITITPLCLGTVVLLHFEQLRLQGVWSFWSLNIDNDSLIAWYVFTILHTLGGMSVGQLLGQRRWMALWSVFLLISARVAAEVQLQTPAHFWEGWGYLFSGVGTVVALTLLLTPLGGLTLMPRDAPNGGTGQADATDSGIEDKTSSST